MIQSYSNKFEVKLVGNCFQGAYKSMVPFLKKHVLFLFIMLAVQIFTFSMQKLKAQKKRQI